MDYKKVIYYSILTIFLLANLFCFFTQQWTIYDTFLNRINYDSNWQWATLSIAIASFLDACMLFVLEYTLNKDERKTKIIITCQLFPFATIFTDSVIFAVSTGLISFISLIYWYFFTFYWKKWEFKDK